MRRSFRVRLMGVVVIALANTALAAAIAVAVAGEARNDAISVHSRYMPAIEQIGQLRLGVSQFRREQLEYVAAISQTDRASAAAAIAERRDEVEAALNGLAVLRLDAEEQAKYAAVEADWQAYLAATENLTTADGAAALAILQAGQGASTYTRLAGDLDSLHTIVVSAATESAADADWLLGLLPLLLVAGCALALAFGLAEAYLLSGRVVHGIRAVSATLKSVSDDCMTSLEAALAALAANDLTVRLEPKTEPIEKYGTDEIGQMAAATNGTLARIRATIGSYEKARANLSGMLGEVHAAARSVSRTSTEVNAAAIQSGEGAAQIAQTISQVASGALEQARAGGDTVNAVNDLQAVIESVRGGAAETARSVEAQAAEVDQITHSIRSASHASADLQCLSAAVGDAAANGAETVSQTINGMARIKDAVEEAAVKVAGLGDKGGQIGAIVETIDDIAEQTNLLALNAAIEAARAGEQGKGFAVVADEVRKLAERSSRATKEIAALIAEVQQGTVEAVEAMEVGAREVESGTDLASKSGAALDEIARAVQSSNAAVARIAKAMDDMQECSAGLVTASDAIAAIAQETNGAAEAMTGSAEQVARAVESIAAISQQNSASAEQVSAATEQLSAQAEEVVASVSTLGEMANQLEDLAAQFRIGEVGPGQVGDYAVRADLPTTGGRRPRQAA
jgi:methyl-accepting chemotaxis protein